MPCPTPCAQCDRTGLPILFTRYATAYHHDSRLLKKLQQLSPKGRLQAHPGGVPLKTACYGVRMLREGYLYLVIERTGPSYPEDHLAYSVHAHGYLNAFMPALDSQPALPKVACDVDTRAANNSLVFVRDARTVKTLWYVFHPNALADDTWQEMRRHPADHGMQRFDVRAWAGGQHEAEHSMLPDQLSTRVLEFAALQDSEARDASEGSLFGLMGVTPTERGWGSYDTTVGELMREHQAGHVTTEQVRGAAQRDGQKGWAHDATPTVMTNPDYTEVHGRRLGQILQLLQSHKNAQGQPVPGAVLACLDPVGITQELAMAQTEAAVQYVQWLLATDDKGVSNRMKDAAVHGIETVRAALASKAVQAIEDTVARLEDSASRVDAGQVPGAAPGASYRVRQADGSVKTLTQDELNRQRAQQMRLHALEARAGEAAAQKKAADDVEQLVDRVALEAFKQEHRQQIERRDMTMNALFDDLAPWLDAKAPWQPVFKRYTSSRPEIGALCAGQLCTILLHVDNSPKGRAYLRARDVLMPGAQQLVWRMMVLNNGEIAAEIQQALESLVQPVPSVLDAQADGQAAQAAAAMAKAITSSKKFIDGATKARKALDTFKDVTKPRGERLTAAGDLVKTGQNNIGSLIAAFAVNQIKAWPASTLEKRLAQAQLLQLVHGMGDRAVDFVNRASQRPPGNPAKRARELQARLNTTAAAAASQAGKLRFAAAGAAFDSLGLAPALRRAAVRQDGRALAEAAKALVDTAAAIKGLRTSVYETLLWKELPDSVAARYVEGVKRANTDKLIALKGTAARWVSAGTAIGVVMDGFDAVEAGKNGDWKLESAYWSRAAIGTGTILSTMAAASYERLPLLLMRLNLVLAVAAAILTALITQLKGKTWENWLQRQPFHQQDSHKTLYTSERAQTLELGEALAELEAE